MSLIIELYGHSTRVQDELAWQSVIGQEWCPFLQRKCVKVRKSAPDLTIGTCTVSHGRKLPTPVIICPHRLLERGKIFTDCLHLLSLHEPGNELHVVPEVSVPGGSIDYCLVSARGEKVKDFVGIELQTLDSTGTLWPQRQRFLLEVGLAADISATGKVKPFGMNWKMTAKTILMQLHHKVETFEGINKHLVLVIQDAFLAYMRREFRFGHLPSARTGDPLHFHAYGVASGSDGTYQLTLEERLSTDANGVAASLGLQADAHMELEQITELLESKISSETIFMPVKM